MKYNRVKEAVHFTVTHTTPRTHARTLHRTHLEFRETGLQNLVVCDVFIVALGSPVDLCVRACVYQHITNYELDSHPQTQRKTNYSYQDLAHWDLPGEVRINELARDGTSTGILNLCISV